jgi:hypothetical protein
MFALLLSFHKKVCNVFKLTKIKENYVPFAGNQPLFIVIDPIVSLFSWLSP